jgi:hypothetical protein
VAKTCSLPSVLTHQRTQVTLLVFLQVLPAVIVDILTLEGGGLRTQPVQEVCIAVRSGYLNRW